MEHLLSQFESWDKIYTYQEKWFLGEKFHHSECQKVKTEGYFSWQGFGSQLTS